MNRTGTIDIGQYSIDTAGETGCFEEGNSICIFHKPRKILEVREKNIMWLTIGIMFSNEEIMSRL